MGNDIRFAVYDEYIPQSKLATNAMNQKIQEMTVNSPNATMSVTGHSLGTMVSIQGVANLPAESIDKIDKVVLFDGPDARSSINNMGPQAQANINKLEADGKIDYYVNPFDIVSMLNRNQKGVDEIGNVHYLMPASVAGTFDKNSAHDFGQIQLNADGTPKEATLKDHPECIAAGISISHTLNPLVLNLEHYLGSKDQAYALVGKLLEAYGKGGIDAVKKVLIATGLRLNPVDTESIIEEAGSAYIKYNNIIDGTKARSKVDGNIKATREKISHVMDHDERIALESQLADLLVKKAYNLVEEYNTVYGTDMEEFEDEVDRIVKRIHDGAYSIKHYLSDSEVVSLIANYTKPALWDGGNKNLDDGELKKYSTKLDAFASTLTDVSIGMKDFDEAAAIRMGQGFVFASQPLYDAIGIGAKRASMLTQPLHDAFEVAGDLTEKSARLLLRISNQGGNE